jgi:hypothetical protein
MSPDLVIDKTSIPRSTVKYVFNMQMEKIRMEMYFEAFVLVKLGN